MSFCKAGGITIRLPLRSSPSCTDNSLATDLYSFIVPFSLHSENTGKIRYLLDLVYFLSNVLSTKLYGNEPVVARYTMEDANCTLTEPLRLMESLSGSSCDKE